MKRYISMILIMCLMFTLVPFKPLKAFASTDALNFADPKLNDIFCEFVGKDKGQVVTKAEVENKMKYFYDNDIQITPEIDIKGVGDLSGMEKLEDIAYPIRQLRIEGNVDLTPIKGYSLNYLELINQSDGNLRMFYDSPSLQNSLEGLYIDEVECELITDISPISVLTNLKTIYIYNTAVTDISPLSNLVNIEVVHLDSLNRYNGTTVDLGCLKDLPLMNNLILGRMNLTSESLESFSQFGAFRNLKNLTINNDSELKSIEYLTNNTTILNLSLHDCGLDNRAIDVVSSMKNLYSLALTSNYIENIDGLHSLDGIKQLSLNDNQIHNIDVFKDGLISLTDLEIEGNYITDISPLKDRTLNRLVLVKNFIDIDGSQENLIDSLNVGEIEYSPQRELIGDKLIEMTVGDTLSFGVIQFPPSLTDFDMLSIGEITNTENSTLNGYFTIESSDSNIVSLSNNIIPFDGIYSEDSGKVDFRALKSGQVEVTILVRGIDSVLTKNIITVKVNEELKPVIKGSYKVEYQDENGNILGIKILDNLVLGNYVELAKFFDGYTLLDDTMKSFDLTETEPNKTIVFKYVKNEEPKPVIKGSYTVEFQDEEGNVLENKSFNDLVLGIYVVFADFIDGYTLNDEGVKYIELTELEPNQVIIFKYKKDEEVKPIILGTYEVQYQDENGKIIDSKEIKELYLGKYTEKAKNIDGYTLNDEEIKVIELTEENSNGIIIFKYKKNKIPVTTEEPQEEIQEEVKEEHKSSQETLPQTGGIFSSNILMMLGVSLIGLGVGFNKKFKR